MRRHVEMSNRTEDAAAARCLRPQKASASICRSEIPPMRLSDTTPLSEPCFIHYRKLLTNVNLEAVVLDRSHPP